MRASAHGLNGPSGSLPLAVNTRTHDKMLVAASPRARLVLMEKNVCVRDVSPVHQFCDLIHMSAIFGKCARALALASYGVRSTNSYSSLNNVCVACVCVWMRCPFMSTGGSGGRARGGPAGGGVALSNCLGCRQLELGSMILSLRYNYHITRLWTHASSATAATAASNCYATVTHGTKTHKPH